MLSQDLKKYTLHHQRAIERTKIIYFAGTVPKHVFRVTNKESTSNVQYGLLLTTNQ